MASAAARERYARKNEGEELERAFKLIDSKKDGKIDASEIEELFKQLKHTPKRGEVEDLLWEVDEDCDGFLTREEFQSMFNRCRDDKSGYEPRGLFNVVEFLMNDKTSSGFITLEEAMQIMYLRYGRAQLDTQLEEVFGTSDLNSGKILTLSEFLSCLHASQVKQLLNKVTAKTYKAPPPGTK